MKDLSTEAQSVVRSVRKIAGPTSAERSRLSAALHARIAAQAVAQSAGSKGAAANLGTKVGFVVTAKKMIVAVLVVSGASISAWRVSVHQSQKHQYSAEIPHILVSSQSPVVPTVVPTTTTNPIVEATPLQHEEVAPIVVPAASTRSSRAAHTGASAHETAPTANSLAQEMNLLRVAQDALQAGHPGAALVALDQHATAFPHGVLREERLAAHVLALCALGRIGEARREAATFLRRSPHSVHAGRVRSSCAATSGAEDRTSDLLH